MTIDRICVGSYSEQKDIYLMYTFLNNGPSGLAV